jgi:hypothetical protein
MKTKNTNYEQLDILWLRAAILGSIWASSEIILGSFLHNLRIPFSGAFLSAIGVYLLTAFDVKWKQPGVVWRAGIICALMKSISPSAFIFGPMIAIVAEAFLFSSAVKLLGRNVVGYGIGGALAVAESLIHKIVNLLIFYGADIYKIYANFYKYAAKVTSLNLGSPVDLILILFAVYFIVGFIVATFGLFAGKKVVPLSLEITGTDGNNFLNRMNKAPYTNHSITWLCIEIATIPLGLFVLSEYPVQIGFSLVFIITAINLLRYKKFLSKRFKLKFWIELALVTTLAGFFMGGLKESGWEFSFNNLIGGFQITLRALLLTECFGLIGIELVNPSIKALFAKMKFGKLQAALEAAFQALPMMLAIVSSHKEKFRTPSVLISGYITFADNWISDFSEGLRTDANI